MLREGNFYCVLAACAITVPRLSAFSADTPPAPVYFDESIAPLIISLSCASSKCHGAENGAGGVKLAMFAGDNAADYEILAKGYKGRFVNQNNPKDSLIMKKLTGATKHGGGALIDADSQSYKTFIEWIEFGCKFKNENAPTLMSIKSELNEIVAKKGEHFKPSFYGIYSDGSKKNLSDMVSLQAPDSKFKINSDNTLSAEECGPSYIVASLNRKFCALPVLVTKDSGGKFPKEEPKGRIDEYVLNKLKQAGVIPSQICSDAEFVRRLYLDATGLLPPHSEIEAFLKSNDTGKRGKLIDKVLASPEFSDRLAMRFADILRIKSEFPSNLWPNAAQAYHTWLRDSIDKHMPYDTMVREMLLSTGSNFKNPPVNFYRAVNTKNAENFAEAASLVFMGVRTSCIKCHVHPEEEWTRSDAAKFSAIFGQLNMKSSKEWKEEILTIDIPDSPQGEPRAVEYFVFGEKIISPADRDTREAFADWLLSNNNPYFAKAAMSRLWYWIFGVGLINPADDIRPNKPSTNPELLAYLETSFRESGYNFRDMMKLIFLSDTYQRSYKSNNSNKDDTLLFSRHIPSRLDAESLNDIISGVLGVFQPFKSITPEPYAFWPENFKAHQLHDGSVSNPFMTLFGKPGRNSSYLNDRSNTLTMQQVLHLSDSANINTKLNESEFLKELAKKPETSDQKIRTLYLAFLTRPPTLDEALIARKYFENSKTPHDAVKDIAWALINSKEFLFKL